jgi:hypothetical protein
MLGNICTVYFFVSFFGTAASSFFSPEAATVTGVVESGILNGLSGGAAGGEVVIVDDGPWPAHENSKLTLLCSGSKRTRVSNRCPAMALTQSLALSDEEG